MANKYDCILICVHSNKATFILTHRFIKEMSRLNCFFLFACSTPAQVAVKMFNENYASFSENEFGSELAIMSVLRHPNICHAIGGSQIPGNRFLVMPLAR
jgi:hypothetical protein